MLPNLPNCLTLLRIAFIPLVVIAFFNDSLISRWLAALLFFLACITDFFDGYFARLLSQTSKIGQILDPIADKLLIISTLFLLAGFGRLPGFLLIPAIIIVSREIFVSALREYFSNYPDQVEVTLLAQGKTTLQMFALGFLLLGDTPVLGPFCQWAGAALLWLAMVITLVTALDYAVKIWRHSRKEGNLAPKSSRSSAG